MALNAPWRAHALHSEIRRLRYTKELAKVDVNSGRAVLVFQNGNATVKLRHFVVDQATRP